MNKTIVILATVTTLGVATSLQAVPITGQLVLEGSANLDSTTLGSATEVTSFNKVFANAASDGVFEEAGLAGEEVRISGFDFTNFSTVAPLWTLLSGDDEFSFALTGLTVADHTGTFLNILGTGLLTSDNPDFDATPGTFSFTISDADGVGGGSTGFKFGFQSSTSASLPDGGATAALLGVGLLGLAAIRRK